MSINFVCPECKLDLKAADDLAGKVGKCPGCSAAVTVPNSSPGKQN